MLKVKEEEKSPIKTEEHLIQNHLNHLYSRNKSMNLKEAVVEV